MKRYYQLSKNERYIIAEKHQSELNKKVISEDLGVHFPTIYCEIKRNSTSKGYNADLAEIKYCSRHKHRLKFHQKNEVLWDMTKGYLRRNAPHNSPKTLSHYLKLVSVKVPCFKTIYSMIWACKKHELNHAYKYFHHHEWRYRPRGHLKTRSKIKKRRDINERAKVIKKRKDFDDWEADLMYFQGLLNIENI